MESLECVCSRFVSLDALFGEAVGFFLFCFRSVEFLDLSFRVFVVGFSEQNFSGCLSVGLNHDLVGYHHK